MAGDLSFPLGLLGGGGGGSSTGIFLPNGTFLTWTNIADGQLFQRSGTTVIGVTAATLGVTTWALRADPTTNAGLCSIFSDLNYTVWVANGVYWQPFDGKAVIFKRCRPDLDTFTGVTAVKTEFTGAKFTIPAGLMQVQSSIYFDALFSATITGTNKPEITFGGSSSQVYVVTAASNINWRAIPRLSNTNSLSAQVGSSGGVTASTVGSTATSALRSLTVNTANANDCQFWQTPANAADTMILQQAEISVIV